MGWLLSLGLNARNRVTGREGNKLRKLTYGGITAVGKASIQAVK
jgi:hypothetical protein